MIAYFCCQNGHAVAEPTEEGLRRIGYSPQRVIPWPWEASMFIKGTTLLVLTGMRQKQREMRDFHSTLGIPWIAFDLPFVRSVAGDARLYIRDHSWLPDVTGLPSRLERLGVTVQEPHSLVQAEAVPVPKGRKPTTAKGKAAARAKAKEAEADAQAVADAKNEAENGYVLVIGQVPRDSSHNMGEGELQKWASAAFEQIHEALPGVEVVWRPHPKAGRSWNYFPPGFDSQHSPEEKTTEESIAGARLVCVYGSTVGLEALIAGKPVVAWGPSCYRELCATPREIATATHPGVEAVEELLERVAYTQWGLDELATGEPFRFILGQMGIECPVVA